jgi:dTDP-4-amino-4,6-dideoxygalactose transaminase
MDGSKASDPRVAADPAQRTTPAQGKIELIDLKAQQARIRARVDAAVARVLDHGQYIMGPEVTACEAQLAAFSGARHCVSCGSGTDALLIPLMAMGVGPGDAVICPSFTFTATPEVVALIGATPVLADVLPATYNLDPVSLESAIETARKQGLTPKVVMPVDLFGLPADYEAIEPIAARHGMSILCDSAQSYGAVHKHRKVGSIGRVTATSFFPAKPLGCYGDGGAVFTDDDALAHAMRSIRLHGKGDDKYDIVRVGINGRMDTIQAAVLMEKLAIFPDEIEARQTVARRYTERLANRVTTPVVPDGLTSVWAQYTVRLPSDRRDRIAAALKAEGIPTAVYYPRPVHQQQAYAASPMASTGLAASERASAEVLSLPMHPYLSAADQTRVCDAIERALDA